MFYLFVILASNAVSHHPEIDSLEESYELVIMDDVDTDACMDHNVHLAKRN